ncbi:unnamed protein product [Clonostachys rhizophaga]|uniref:Pyruvate carboxyltransferase domain-containing protein n=1 Tax=Clonostachys rhizophaga TaxID=160324 RepID=A0A9N9W2I9_9HYPO|nr:unnamed protein product [Clonostachys rhizophaga]
MSSTHPITHHTSHTMDNGASSSSSGSNQNGAECVLHHTSHTMANGAASGASNGSDQGGVLDTSLANLATDNMNLTNNTTTDIANDASAPASSAASTVSDDDFDSDLTTGALSSAASSTYANFGNTSNFSIIDSTLREGEQFANAYFNTEQKLKIAQALDDFGAEYIEVTSPAASPQSRDDCAAICKLGLKAKVLCHIRCNMDDARIAIDTGVDGINMCIGTSKQLMENSHGKDLDFIAKKAAEVIAFVKAHNVEIRFSGEDSFRSDFNEIIKLYSLCDRLGAGRVGIADTVGGATPMEVYNKISTLRQFVSCDIETHFHNDTGCANANAFTALEAGATHIDTTVLGIGERNGITSIGGLMKVLMPHSSEYLQRKYNFEKLPALEALVAETVGVEIPYNNPTFNL